MPEATAGHGGVPLMIFMNGEPFFGQDRFGEFFWRLRQNGLTERHEPRAPVRPRPLTLAQLNPGETRKQTRSEPPLRLRQPSGRTRSVNNESASSGSTCCPS